MAQLNIGGRCSVVGGLWIGGDCWCLGGRWWIGSGCWWSSGVLRVGIKGQCYDNSWCSIGVCFGGGCQWIWSVGGCVIDRVLVRIELWCRNCYDWMLVGWWERVCWGWTWGDQGNRGGYGGGWGGRRGRWWERERWQVWMMIIEGGGGCGGGKFVAFDE